MQAPDGFYVPAVFDDESPSPRSIVGRVLGLATAACLVAALIMRLSSGQMPWALVGLAGTLWATWGFIGGLFSWLFEPAGRFLADQLTGNVSLPITPETLDEETARFERMLSQGLDRHHEILVAIRLAEIYRINQRDPVKSDALLARLRAKYPDAPELEHGDAR